MSIATQTPRPAGALIAACLLAASCFVLFVARVRFGLHYLPFGDEAGHFLGAQAIHHGDVLYRDFIDAHGPVVFMLTHAWGVAHGFTDLGSARLIPAVLALLAAAAIAASPALPTAAARLLAAGTWIGLIAAFWLVQGLYLDDYFTIGGACLVVELALVGWPGAIGHAQAPWPAAIAGFAAPFACLSAYAFAPAALLLLAPPLVFPVAGRPRAALAAGFAVGSLLNALWLLRFADPVGMLVYHVILNQTDYAHYLDLTLGNLRRSLTPSFTPSSMAQSWALLACATGAVALLAGAAHDQRRLPATLLVLLAIGSLDARLTTMFQDGTLLMAAFAMPALLLGMLAARAPLVALVLASLTVTACELGARRALGSPTGDDRRQMLHAPHLPLGSGHDPLSRRIRALTSPGDRILAIPYAPGIIEAASRLPIRKYHDYLPWEADYARHPWWGRKRDLCHDLPELRPVIIVFDDWAVWGRYRAADYMPCVLGILHRGYRPDPTLPRLWVRRDVPDP